MWPPALARAAACFSLRDRTSLKIHSWRPLSKACACATPPRHRADRKSHSGCSLLTSHHRMPQCVPSHDPRTHAVPPCELTVGRVALGRSCFYRRVPACSSPRDRTHGSQRKASCIKRKGENAHTTNMNFAKTRSPESISSYTITICCTQPPRRLTYQLGNPRSNQHKASKSNKNKENRKNLSETNSGEVCS
ncbi:hypothetical protein PIB30_050681 [Stylosanthes scabra]|uniref:Secreted protein n=1 Tax=Stylosanthes scabra TaxID=79078 RepID=A0ABU6QJ92_9FABA|nr:hypothetical protein [Stylosanthes scabra]